ncbi:adenylate kinase family protein [Marinomonas colpomeniae]|uniref:Nucleoside monophosphate kinase n=1 Tax=Marinomonas colpomeniae TaxID=2774408 RepID=A0ABR8NZ98_9GAMM|nr:nucleoside monophosphate kinase [Marinomonas colpomeniae]MBD5771380.1 nucleoside monophosphate kinase [Marinomonas colpomeniae]
MHSGNQFTSLVQVEKIKVREPGVIILTGPSSCGKGEVASALCRTLSIRPEAHLSMGEILRSTFRGAKEDPSFAELLATKYELSNENNIYDCIDTTEALSAKVRSYQAALEKYFEKTGMDLFTSQLEWLEFCTMNGLLVPNRWTENFVAAHIEQANFANGETFILDGYPRTQRAAEHLLNFLDSMDIPVLKVLHLSISRQEMMSRAQARGREDDDNESLFKRFQFYIENVQPSVDFMKTKLGSDRIALIDAHQPVFDQTESGPKFNLDASINAVVSGVLKAMGVPRIVLNDILMADSNSK